MLKQEFLLETLTNQTVFQNKRRGELEIIAKILALCINGKYKTNLLYGANLSFVQGEKYIDHLQLRGLIRRDGRKYFTTDKGELVLGLFTELNKTILGSH